MSQQRTTTDGGDQSTEWIRVVPVGMIPPGLPEKLAGGCRGTVRDGEYIDLDGVDGCHLKLKEPAAIHNGERVIIKRLRGGVEFAKHLSVYQREKAEKDLEKRREAEKRKQEKNRKRRDAEMFWDRYEIPFEYDVGIKGRRSGLLKGSTGNGRARNTVNHLVAKEYFKDGRLSRGPDQFICSTDAKIQFTEERYQDGDGDAYMPEVTCQTCRDRMRRWWDEAE